MSACNESLSGPSGAHKSDPAARTSDITSVHRTAYVNLNRNENPFPLPAVVMSAALEAFKEHNVYPEEDSGSLRSAAARAYGVSVEQVIAGNGSSEILGLIYQAYLTAGDAVAMLSPGFGFNHKLAAANGAHLLEVQWADHNALPTAQRVRQTAGGAKFIVLANPNNPTGTFVPIVEIERLVAETDQLVVLDEAYVDFAPDSGLRLVDRYQNLLLLRTFSKSYAAAGLRIGFGVGDPQVISRLRSIQNLFNMNVIGQSVGVSIFEHRDAYRGRIECILQERERTTLAPSALGFHVMPSHANFVLARVPGRYDGRWWQRALQARNVYVATFPEQGLEHFVRISIGTAEQMDTCLSVVSDIAGAAT
ncbi:pyridoxal phosphate-dependent aminotransferase [Bradyrhizobium sp. DOA9]|uniref:pyridoxal phosphate-dependent aminotransferase n=1 Tax=Bradyrhizobium sp. DOA9 TaxID=1126627 RepID=UPI0004998946|nr:histidinol-phosphate aminotransferase 3 [Bradyrhizobium sp. DOA9]